MTTPQLRPARPSTPVPVLVLGVAGLAVIVLPILALCVRVPFRRLPEVAAEETTLTMLQVTVNAALLATLITTLLGVPMALWLNNLPRGSRVLRLFVMLPLAMPPVVGGLALTAAVGRRGYAAPLLDALHLQFAFAFPGVVLAHVFVALPFVVVAVDGALQQLDREILASAAGVGLSPFRVLRHITMPAIAPSVAMGAGLAFARSLGEFGTTITFAGSMPGITRTMPLGIYLEREVDQDRAYVLAALLISLAVVVILLSMLPLALRRRPQPRPATITELNATRLAALTAPTDAGRDVTVSGGVGTVTFPARSVTALVGPNGSGKSTLAGMIAGRLRGSRVQVGDLLADDTASTFVPAHRRGVVLLTQRPGLPQTTTVAGALNMVTRSPSTTADLLQAAGLFTLRDTPVPALSGGQAAQVALVRALASRPAVLILDEPLAAIDVESAARWRRLLQAAAQDRTTILITHDPLDLAGLARTIVVMESARAAAVVSPQAFFDSPPSPFAAQLAGVNRLTGTVLATDGDLITVDLGGGIHAEGFATQATPAIGAPAVVICNPHDVTLEVGSGARESARNRWPGTVVATQEVSGAAALAAGGARSLLTVQLTDGSPVLVPVTVQSARDLGVQVGMPVRCVVKALNVRVFPG